MPSELTVKQQRDARRAEKVAAQKRKLAIQKRNRRIAIIGSSVGAAAILALIIIVIVSSFTPKVDPEDIVIEGLENFGEVTGVHVDTDEDAANDAVDYAGLYDMNPPAGGDHWAGWLNCGVYSEPQENERAVHALEHGSVWVTYDPELVDAAGVETLRSKLPDTYSVLSPYPGLPAPVVVSAWANQVQLDGVDDPRLAQFITKFWRSPSVPEPNGVCTGGVDGAGRIA